MATRVLAQAKETPNFLLPNATSIVVFVIFLLVLIITVLQLKVFRQSEAD